MTFSESISTCLKKYADFKGRARRSEYWWFFVFQMAVGFGLGILGAMFGVSEDGVNGFSGLFGLAILLPSIAVTTRRLHEHARKIHCVAVEPAEALHGLEGLKHLESSIVPAIYDASVPDELMRVATEDGWDMADRVAAEEGLHIGHSTGANIFAAVKIAERLQREQGGGCVVTIACDRGDRYFAPMKWEKRYLW